MRGEIGRHSSNLLVEDPMTVPTLRSFRMDLGFNFIRDDGELFLLRLGSTLETTLMGDSFFSWELL